MRGLLKTVIALGTAGALWGGPVRAEGGSTSHEAMLSLSASMKALEAGLDRGDTKAVRSYADRLENTAINLSSVRPLANTELDDEFDRLRSRLADLAQETSLAASREGLSGARAILPEIRQTCTACHLKFRTENDRRGLYPARRNTIAGRVRLTKLGGKAREDASNIVVFLDGTGRRSPYPPPRVPPVLSQRNREFSPSVLPLLRGSTVEFPNDDTIFHNVFSLARARPFDLGIYRSGRSKSVTFDQPGLVTVHCNIHPNMVANLLVLNNPHFTVTDRSGLFVLSGVPDGTYQLRTWNRFGASGRREITVAGGSLSHEDFSIREDSKAVQHRDKHGRPYREKYH